MLISSVQVMSTEEDDDFLTDFLAEVDSNVPATFFVFIFFFLYFLFSIF